jgi:hypothetical protein
MSSSARVAVRGNLPSRGATKSASVTRERPLQGGMIMAKGNNAQKKETKKPKKDSAKNVKKK